MIYDVLLQLPVFQGITKDQLTGILEKIPFHFQKYQPEEVIVSSGDPCDSVLFVLSGTVTHEMPTYDGRVIVKQDFEGPYTMPFYYLFGVSTNMPSRLVAKNVVGIMKLEKKHFLDILQSTTIPLVNVLNMLSTHAQKQHQVMDFMSQKAVLARLASWLLTYTDRVGKDIFITASEADWCKMLNTDPADFWRNVAILEGKHVIEQIDEGLKLIDRYALRGFVGNK
ncbi:MAG: Crp/Fnr family transcriptional regulator [Bacteroidales bacterium]|nr:Crp/Fnr family transcriptional regulator [Bacteroidales bacterium]